MCLPVKTFAVILILSLATPAFSVGWVRPNPQNKSHVAADPSEVFQSVVQGHPLFEEPHEYDVKRAEEKSAEIESNLKKAVEKPKEFAVGAMRTSILIMVLAGVNIVKQEIRQAKVQGRQIDPAFVSEAIVAASWQIVNSGGIWMGLAASDTVGLAMKKPMSILQSILSRQVSRDLLRSLLQSGIESVITFVGWELAGELWDESRLMLGNKDDYLATDKLVGLFEPDKRALFGRVFRNMGAILLSDGRLLNDLFYNTWRLRIATGDFATMVSSMVIAGAVGTALFPGAGTLAGMGFGLVGGAVSTFIPQPVKDLITLNLKATRGDWNAQWLNMNTAELNAHLDLGWRGQVLNGTNRAAVTTAKVLLPFADFLTSAFNIYNPTGMANYFVTPKEIKNAEYDRLAQHFSTDLKKILNQRSEIRNHFLNTLFETEYLLRLRVQEANHEIGVVTETLKRQQSESALRNFWQNMRSEMAANAWGSSKQDLGEILLEDRLLVAVCQKGTDFIETQLLNFYRDEQKEILASEKDGNIANADQSLDLLSDESANIEILIKFMDQFYLGLNPSSKVFEHIDAYKKNPEKYPTLRQHLSLMELEKILHRGFNEAETVQLWLNKDH